MSRAGSGSLTALTVGAGACSLRAQPSTRRVIGTVVGTFARGWYTRCGADLIAIGSIPSGPMHLQVAPAIATPATPVAEGASVTIGPDGTRLGPLSIDVTGVVEWSPSLPTGDELAVFAERMTALDVDDLIGDDLADVWPEVRSSAEGPAGEPASDLDGIVGRLAGRGDGLTPTGDDVVAGILLADAWRRPGCDAEGHRVRVAARARTSDLSRGFLKWAALGQSIEPVHQLVEAASGGTTVDFASALQTVARIGGSSGRGLLAGLALGLAAVQR